MNYKHLVDFIDSPKTCLLKVDLDLCHALKVGRHPPSKPREVKVENFQSNTMNVRLSPVFMLDIRTIEQDPKKSSAQTKIVYWMS